jgi:hypothetical protein
MPVIWKRDTAPRGTYRPYSKMGWPKDGEEYEMIIIRGNEFGE